MDNHVSQKHIVINLHQHARHVYPHVKHVRANLSVWVVLWAIITSTKIVSPTALLLFTWLIPIERHAKDVI